MGKKKAECKVHEFSPGEFFNPNASRLTCLKCGKVIELPRKP